MLYCGHSWVIDTLFVVTHCLTKIHMFLIQDIKAIHFCISTSRDRNVRWARELNTLQYMQIEKAPANKKKKCLHQFDNTHAANTRNATKYRNALQIQKRGANTCVTYIGRNSTVYTSAKEPASL